MAMDNERPLRVWCLLRDQLGHIKPVEERFGDRAEFIYDTAWDPAKMTSGEPDIVVCVNDIHYDVSRCLDAARGGGVPSLVLQDGILEWRCQYENPKLGAGGGAPQHQPVLADKIACIGPSSARHIASWGNAAKVEVTGMPRLDYLLMRPGPVRNRPGSRILVMTAKKPGFTEEQTATTVRSLQDVKNHLDTLRGVDVVWRLTKDLETQLGVENQLQSLAGSELTDLLSRVDAVITTPSTAMLEAMLLDRPVACLDYHNVPRFVPAAWTISAAEHIGGVVSELLDPPVSKLVFQRECLREALVCDGSAAPRVAELMDRMVAVARKARHAEQKPNFTAHIIEFDPIQTAGTTPALRDFYPSQEVFLSDDLESVQVRLARAEKENETLKRQLETRRLGYWAGLLARKTIVHLKSIRRALC